MLSKTEDSDLEGVSGPEQPASSQTWTLCRDQANVGARGPACLEREMLAFYSPETKQDQATAFFTKVSSESC